MEFKKGDTIEYDSMTGYVVRIYDPNNITIKMYNGGLKSVSSSDIKHIKIFDNNLNHSISCAINHPAYYNDGKIEVIDFIKDKGLNFNKGNAVKYIARAGKKDKAKEVEDLQKAKWYIEREIKRVGVDR